MKKPDLYLLSILDFDGITILNKIILSFDDLEDRYFTQFWYLKNYIGIEDEFEQYQAVFKKMPLEIAGSTETEFDLLNSVKVLIN